MNCRLVVCLLIAALTAPLNATAAEPDEILLTMPEPPLGYTVTKQRLEVEGEILGYNILVASEESFGKVLVQVETSFDRTSRPARVAALKGYVNGMATSLRDAGFELTSKSLPELETTDFGQPITVETQYANTDEVQVFVRQFFFFTDKGYNVQIMANDQEQLDRLSKWAAHIRPATELAH